MDISVVIPTYKNTDLLVKNLKHNLPYLKGCNVIIVNDDPALSIKKDLKDFSHITLIENNKNGGFSKSVNLGVNHATSPYVMLLNNDVQLLNTNYQQAIDDLKNDPSLFAISFAQKQNDGSIVGKNRIYWNNGFFQHERAHDLNKGINAWAEGGCCLIDKTKLDRLGGFDLIYTPFYWEDIDLSYRAWKNGYKIVFDPTIIVYHNHESTIGKYYDKSTIQKVAYRNQFLFIWRNITDATYLISHLIKLPQYLLYYGIVKRNKEFIGAFFEALSLWKTVARKRNLYKTILTDKQILNYFHE